MEVKKAFLESTNVTEKQINLFSNSNYLLLFIITIIYLNTFRQRYPCYVSFLIFVDPLKVRILLKMQSNHL